jgi:prepilin-type N-terminal cleavage/methylation domain-containing protein
MVSRTAPSGAAHRGWARSRLHPSRDLGDGGFSLIELLIVIVIIPLVVGAISVALTAVLKQQDAVTSKVSNSGDTSVLSAVFAKDVQSAQSLTTKASASSPSACTTNASILSLQWPSTSTVVVSYAVVAQGSNYSLVRYYCEGAVTTTSVVAHNVQSGLTAAVTGAFCNPFGCTENGEPAAAAAGWASAVGVSAVTLNVQAPEQTNTGISQYKYALIGVPRVSNNVSRGGSNGGHAPLLALGGGSPGITCTGGDSLTVNGTAAVNSTSTPAIRTTGTASFGASSIYTDTSTAQGVLSGSNITPSTPTQTGVNTVDPYAGLPLPVAEPLPMSPAPPVFTDGNLAADGPGIYLNAVSVNSAITIQPGIYIFQNGLGVSGNGAISGSSGAPVSALFYIHSGSLSMSGNAALNLQPYSSNPYTGLTIWQDASDSSAMTVLGNGTSIGGTVYAPAASVGVGGNGNLNIGSLVADNVTCNGGGNAGGISITNGGP